MYPPELPSENIRTEAYCDHNLKYAGVRFKDTADRLPGSGAHRREYFDLYYCTRCGEERPHRLPYEDCTYDQVKYGATPLR